MAICDVPARHAVGQEQIAPVRISSKEGVGPRVMVRDANGNEGWYTHSTNGDRWSAEEGVHT